MNDGQSYTGNHEHEIIIKSGNVLNGVVDGESGLALPGDKSISHRAILLSALAEGESHVKNILISGVTRVMINGLEQLGVKINIDGHTLHLQGNGLRGFQKSPKRINCENSATTLRLLAGAVAASGTQTILDGSEGLRLRPMQRIVDPLRLMGVDITSADGSAPLKISSNNYPLKAIEYTMPVASAQVKSCILLTGLAVEGVVIIKEPCHSRDHTERMLISMGLNLQKGYDQREQLYLTRMSVRQPVKLNPLKYIIPGDISAAAFLIVAATIVPGSKVILRNVLLNPTRTGLIDTLNEMGADIQKLNLQEKYGEPVGDLIIRYSKLHGALVSGSRVVRMIDEFPVFTVAAAVANGKTIVREAEELRLKESDRISSMCEELRNLGVNALEYPDGFEIDGGTAIVGGHVDPHRDHRLAMAMTVAGLVSEQPVRVQNSEIIQESFPNFVQIMQNLGADIELRTNY